MLFVTWESLWLVISFREYFLRRKKGDLTIVALQTVLISGIDLSNWS